MVSAASVELSTSPFSLFLSGRFSSGAITMYMLRPSSSGCRSTIPCSANTSAVRISRSRPRLAWLISRPRKRTVTLTRSPLSRNSAARRAFVLRSWTSILTARRTSLKVCDFCFFFCSRSRFWSSYLYCPKSRMRHTGGTAVGATSTRSSPFSWARASAFAVGMTPSCCPSSSMTLTSRMRINSLMRRSLASLCAPLQQQGHLTDHGRVALQRTRNAGG